MMYLEEYMDTIESLPSELQRGYTLLRELDSGTKDLAQELEERCQNLIQRKDHVKEEERNADLRELEELLTKALQRSQEKVSLATKTYEMVDRHIKKLEENLKLFEVEYLQVPSDLHLHTGLALKRKGNHGMNWDCLSLENRKERRSVDANGFFSPFLY
jgi:hypothetical protein